MQNNLASIETFKCDAITGQRTPSTQLVLAAQPQERETPIPEAYVPAQYDQSEHRARYDAALDGTTTRGQRALMFLIVAIVFLGWAFSLYLVWRMR